MTRFRTVFSLALALVMAVMAVALNRHPVSPESVAAVRHVQDATPAVQGSALSLLVTADSFQVHLATFHPVPFRTGAFVVDSARLTRHDSTTWRTARMRPGRINGSRRVIANALGRPGVGWRLNT